MLAWDAPNRDCGYPSSVALDGVRVLTIYYQVNDLETAPRSAQARGVIWKPTASEVKKRVSVSRIAEIFEL